MHLSSIWWNLKICETIDTYNKPMEKRSTIPTFFLVGICSFPDDPCWKNEDDYIRNYIEYTSDQNAHFIVEASGIGYEGIPYRFSWRTKEDGYESADSVVYGCDNNDDPGTVPHERIDGLSGGKQAEVLQQNSCLNRENGRGIDDLSNVKPLSDDQS